MSLNSVKLYKRSTIFLYLLQVNREKCKAVVAPLKSIWKIKIQSKKTLSKRWDSLFTMKGRLWAFLLFYRSCVAHEVISYLFRWLRLEVKYPILKFILFRILQEANRSFGKTSENKLRKGKR